MRRAPSRRPSDAGPRETTKSFSLLRGNFLDGIWVAHKRLQEHCPAPFGGWLYPKSKKKRHFDTFFRRLFCFLRTTKCSTLQHFCVLTSFAGTMQKRKKCCKYQKFLDSRCTKHCKYQRFWKRKNATIYNVFCNSKKTWKAGNTVNSGVLATFGRWNAGIYPVFCAWRRQTLVIYNIFCIFETCFFVLIKVKKIRWNLRIFQKIEHHDVNKTL